MSSLFYLNDEVQASIPLKNTSKFSRTVSFTSLYELLYQIYYDRINGFYSYEDSILVVITNNSIIPSNLLNSILLRFLPIINFKIFDSNSIDLINDYFDNELNDDLSITKNDIIRTNHWMYHDNHQCSTSIYSMTNHLLDYRNLMTNADDNNNNNNIPKDIQNINFASLLDLDLSESKHYLNIVENWSFSAINLSIKDLIKCAFFLLRHLISLNNDNSKLLEISNNKLLIFILTIEASYHRINKFHNFRHAVDVMQATYNLSKLTIKNNNSIILLLCLSAIGHDLGHPGTNNLIMAKDISNNAPLPKTSILENFHQTIFIYLIKDQWPNLIKFMNVNVKNEKNIFKNSILSTDMSFHDDYVNRLIEINNKEKHETLDLDFLISLIIKAADISNVTRPLVISSQWAYLITLEFNNFSLLNESYDLYQNFKKNSNDINNKTLLFDKFKGNNTNNNNKINILNDLSLDLPDLIEKYPSIINGQLFFINNFAESFFTQLAIALPQLNFLVANIKSNKDYWLKEQKEREK